MLDLECVDPNNILVCQTGLIFNTKNSYYSVMAYCQAGDLENIRNFRE